MSRAHAIVKVRVARPVVRKSGGCPINLIVSGVVLSICASGVIVLY